MSQQEIRVLKNLIGVRWITPKADRTERVYNPATGEIIAYVPVSSKEDVDEAVHTAHEAFQSWKEIAVPKRARIMFKYQQLLVEHWDELARILTIENGKNLIEARGEVLRGIECVEMEKLLLR